MRRLLYIIALLLLIGWILGVFAYALFFIGIIATLVFIIRGNPSTI
jgi:hypothetical protein